MFINAGLGILGIYSQIGWILGLFGRNADDYPAYVHVVPVLYYVLYTFLLRRLLLDVTRSRDNPARRRLVEAARSEEHTSELQSLMRISYAVFCLKKKNTLT